MIGKLDAAGDCEDHVISSTNCTQLWVPSRIVVPTNLGYTIQTALVSSNFTDHKMSSAVFRCFLVLILQLAFVCQAIEDNRCVAPSTIVKITNVTEDFPIGSSIIHLDIGGTDDQIELSLDGASVANGIELNRTSRDLIYARRINYTQLTVYVQCVIKGGVTFSRAVTVYITIVDINDHPPSFVSPFYNINISESLDVGSQLTTVEAVDADSADITSFTFAVDPSSSPFASSFSFPVPTARNLVLVSRLSYDQVTSINLTITVTDNDGSLVILGKHQPQFVANATVFIRVLRDGCRNPNFTQSTYTAVVSVATQPLTDVQTNAAILAISDSAVIIYEILKDSFDDWQYFSINNASGQLTTRRTFSVCLAATSLAFQIKASELQNPLRYGVSLVKIHLVRTGLPPPPLIFTQSVYNVSIPESSPVGSLVVVARVRRPTDNCTVPAWNSNEPAFYFDGLFPDFSIDNATGEVRTTRSLNASIVQSYSLLVRVTDESSVNTSTVVVNVQRPPPTIDYNPRFSNRIYHFNVSRDAGVIGQVQATDENIGSRITYSLLVNPIDGVDLFSIDSDGRLRMTSTSTPNPAPYVTLVVTANDDSYPPRQDVALVVVSFQPISTSVPPTVSTSTPMIQPGSTSTATTVATPKPEGVANAATPETYRTGIIVIGVICGVLGLLLFFVIAVLIFVYRKPQLLSCCVWPWRRRKSSKRRHGAVRRESMPPDVTDGATVTLIDYTLCPYTHRASRACAVKDDGRSAYERAFHATKDYSPYMPYVAPSGESSSDAAGPSTVQPSRHSSTTGKSDSSGRSLDGQQKFAVAGRSQPSSAVSSRTIREQDEDTEGTMESGGELNLQLQQSPPTSRSPYGSKSKAAEYPAQQRKSPATRTGLFTRNRPADQPVMPVYRVEHMEIPAIGMDPGTTSSTETLMGPSQSSANRRSATSGSSYMDSAQGINGYVSSPDGSTLSFGTQPPNDAAPGITVYY